MCIFVLSCMVARHVLLLPLGRLFCTGVRLFQHPQKPCPGTPVAQSMAAKHNREACTPRLPALSHY